MTTPPAPTPPPGFRCCPVKHTEAVFPVHCPMMVWTGEEWETREPMQSFTGYYAELLPDTPSDPWQPIASAPKDGTPVLVYCPGLHEDSRITVAYWSRSLWQLVQTGSYAGDGDLDGDPTHWMPRPKVP